MADLLLFSPKNIIRFFGCETITKMRNFFFPPPKKNLARHTSSDRTIVLRLAENERNDESVQPQVPRKDLHLEV